MMRFVEGLLFLSLVMGARAERVLRVENSGDLAVAAGVLATPAPRGAERLVVRMAPGNYVLKQTLRILRSNVALLGGPGVRFHLADGADQPAIAVGSQSETPTESERIERIRLSGFEVDGNRREQTCELSRRRPWIRNNGIDVRMAKDLRIEKVRVAGCRSGGLVISWKCSKVRVKDSEFADNFFDGVAYYDSERIETAGCAMRRNGGAGVSADNHFAKSKFVDCEIADNRDVGVFMRASRRIVFDRCEIARCRSWGVFLAHNDSGAGVHDVGFRRCRFLANNGGIRMASVNDWQSSGTEIVDCLFQGNTASGRANIDTAGSAVRVKGNH
jgi:nitrous oxidase accessory protein NosD